jgi:hypothetical protein
MTLEASFHQCLLFFQSVNFEQYCNAGCVIYCSLVLFEYRDEMYWLRMNIYMLKIVFKKVLVININRFLFYVYSYEAF